jgi:E3 ubiquitin-protein ligase BIG BROTHER and related proteins
MENSKEGGAGEKAVEVNPNPNPSAVNSDESAVVAAAAEAVGPARRPFTELSQVDADLALARVLQEQASDLLPSLYLSDFFLLTNPFS